MDNRGPYRRNRAGVLVREARGQATVANFISCMAKASTGPTVPYSSNGNNNNKAKAIVTKDKLHEQNSEKKQDEEKKTEPVNSSSNFKPQVINGQQDQVPAVSLINSFYHPPLLTGQAVQNVMLAERSYSAPQVQIYGYNNNACSSAQETGVSFSGLQAHPGAIPFLSFEQGSQHGSELLIQNQHLQALHGIIQSAPIWTGAGVGQIINPLAPLPQAAAWQNIAQQQQQQTSIGPGNGQSVQKQQQVNAGTGADQVIQPQGPPLEDAASQGVQQVEAGQIIDPHTPLPQATAGQNGARQQQNNTGIGADQVIDPQGQPPEDAASQGVQQVNAGIEAGRIIDLQTPLPQATAGQNGVRQQQNNTGETGAGQVINPQGAPPEDAADQDIVPGALVPQLGAGQGIHQQPVIAGAGQVIDPHVALSQATAGQNVAQQQQRNLGPLNGQGVGQQEQVDAGTAAQIIDPQGPVLKVAAGQAVHQQKQVIVGTAAGQDIGLKAPVPEVAAGQGIHQQQQVIAGAGQVINPHVALFQAAAGLNVYQQQPGYTGPGQIINPEVQLYPSVTANYHQPLTLSRPVADQDMGLQSSQVYPAVCAYQQSSACLRARAGSTISTQAVAPYSSYNQPLSYFIPGSGYTINPQTQVYPGVSPHTNYHQSVAFSRLVARQFLGLQDSMSVQGKNIQQSLASAGPRAETGILNYQAYPAPVPTSIQLFPAFPIPGAGNVNYKN